MCSASSRSANLRQEPAKESTGLDRSRIGPIRSEPQTLFHLCRRPTPAKERNVSTSTENPFWAEFRQFLGEFLESLSPVEGLSDERAAMFWWREGTGSLSFDQEESRRYRALLRNAQRAVAPQDDLSRATIDRALQDAMFSVAVARRQAAGDAAELIEPALRFTKEILEGRPKEFVCWIEVHGFDASALPSHYGGTAFEPFGQSHLDRLEAIDQATNAPIPQASARHMLGPELSFEGRVIAVQQVYARDSKAAIALAAREVAATLDCLNCFVEDISYNRAVLRVANGQRTAGAAIRFAYSEAGSFRNSPKGDIPWEYSMKHLWELDGTAGHAMRQLDELLRHDRRTEVEELLVRAARWVGRASAADTAEDCFLYSWIGIDCMMKPVSRKDKTLLGRIKWMLSDFSDVGEVGSLWRLRNALVHDGRLEIPEFDKRMLQTVALNLLVRLLVNAAVKSIETLADLDRYLESQVKGT